MTMTELNWTVSSPTPDQITLALVEGDFSVSTTLSRADARQLESALSERGSTGSHRETWLLECPLLDTRRPARLTIYQSSRTLNGVTSVWLDASARRHLRETLHQHLDRQPATHGVSSH